MPAVQVPYLPTSAIEDEALALLYEFSVWRGRPARPPIEVDLIAEGYLGLELAIVDLARFLGVEGEVLGAVLLDERRLLVDESLDGKEGRFSFTVAHEVGHFRLHRPLFEAQKLTLPLFSSEDLPEQPAFLCRSSQKAPIEWQADRFAAALLMPAAEVRAAVRAVSGDSAPRVEGLDARRRACKFDPELKELASAIIERGGFLNVSNEAMRYRLFDLHLVLDASHPQTSLF